MNVIDLAGENLSVDTPGMRAAIDRDLKDHNANRMRINLLLGEAFEEKP